MASTSGPRSRFEAVVFDFDGVIVESTEIKTRAFLELFRAFPEHLEAIRRHHLDNLGLSRFRKFEWFYDQLLGRRLTAEESERLGREYSALVLDRMLECPLVPGALDSLRAIHGRIPAWVASGTPQDELRIVVEKRGLGGYFEDVFGSPATKEEILRSILAERDLAPDTVLMVGDGLSDYRAATAIGMAFLARESPTSLQDWAAFRVPRVPDLSELASRLGLPAA